MSKLDILWAYLIIGFGFAVFVSLVIHFARQPNATPGQRQGLAEVDAARRRANWPMAAAPLVMIIAWPALIFFVVKQRGSSGG